MQSGRLPLLALLEFAFQKAKGGSGARVRVPVLETEMHERQRGLTSWDSGCKVCSFLGPYASCYVGLFACLRQSEQEYLCRVGSRPKMRHTCRVALRRPICSIARVCVKFSVAGFARQQKQKSATTFPARQRPFWLMRYCSATPLLFRMRCTSGPAIRHRSEPNTSTSPSKALLRRGLGRQIL